MKTVDAARMPQFIAENSNVLIFFHDDAPAEALAFGATLGDTPGAWQAGLVDVAEAPEIRAAFGLEGNLPAVMIMRDEVGLFCGPLSAKSREELPQLISRAAALDMSAVKADIEAERQREATVYERRVCPTARRGPMPRGV